MNTLESNADRRQISLPPLLRKHVEGRAVTVAWAGDRPDDGFRIALNGEPVFFLHEWQYHILNGLGGFGGDTLKGLHDLVSDRFGLDLSDREIKSLFLELKEHALVEPAQAARHTLVRNILDPQPQTIEEAKARPTAPINSRKVKGLRLMRPMWLLRLLRPFFLIGTVCLFLLPPMVVFAGFELATNWTLATERFIAVHRNLDLLTLVILGLLSVNLVASMVYACAAYEAGATVEAIGIRFVFGIVPRFALWIEDTEKLSRRQAIWLHAAPLLTRLFLTAAAVLVWDATRPLGGIVPGVALAVGSIAAISFVLALCPFHKGHGYLLLIEFLDEPKLREKAFRSLLNAFNRGYHQNVDGRVITAYALASLLFMLMLVIGVLFILKVRFVHEFGSAGYVALGGLVALLAWRTWIQFKTTNELYWKNYRFERWRARTLPSEEQKKAEARTRLTPWRALRGAMLAGLAILLIQPYDYRPSGAVTLVPLVKQQLTSDIEGVVGEIFQEGGTFVKAGEPIAKLVTDDLEAQLRVLKARQTQVEVDRTFATIKCDRQRELFETGTISDAELERSLAECATTEAALEPISAEIDRVKSQIARSTFVMPFDGQLGALYLEDRLGEYLNEGQPIAEAQDTSAFRVRLQVREADLAMVSVGRPVEVRVYAYPGEIFEGSVLAIDPDVLDDRGDRTVEVVATIDNRNQLLRTGMSGFAKTGGETMPIWRILTLAFYRFVTIDLWAWLP